MYNGFNYVTGSERYSQFCDSPYLHSDPGSPVVKDYVLQSDAKGREVLECVGEFNLYDRIQSHKDSVNIHTILARFNNGDMSVLNARAVQYFDTTEMPDNLADAHRYVQNGHYLFERLPSEIKEKFNNSFDEFVHAIGSKAFIEAFAKTEPMKDDTVKEVTKDAES